MVPQAYSSEGSGFLYISSGFSWLGLNHIGFFIAVAITLLSLYRYIDN